MKNLKQGFSVVEVLLAILAICLVGIAGKYTYDKRQSTNKPTSIQSEQQPKAQTSTISGTAPTTLYDPTNPESKNYCLNLLEKDGTGYDLFTANSETYTFKNAKSGIEFSYPKSWGEVLVDEEEQPVCVGPFAIGVGIEGEYGQGDGDLITSSHGYFVKDGKYYHNWFKDSENGPTEITTANGQEVYEIATSDSKAIATISTVYDFWATEASINVDNDKYDGLGISDRRIYKEIIDLQNELDGQPSNQQEATYSLSQIKDELAEFVKTVKIENLE